VGGMQERHDLGPRHRDGLDAAVALVELPEVEAEEVEKRGVRPGGKVFAGELGHAAVVFALAAGVKVAAAVVAAEVAVEEWADVVELVEDRDEFPVEILVEEARQAEGHEVEELALAMEIALHLIKDIAARAREGAAAKAQRGDAGLQAVWLRVARLQAADEEAGRVDVGELRAAADDVVDEAADVA